MARSTLIKPNHKAIQQYYEALKTYGEHHVKHEGALETASQRLIADAGRLHSSTCVPKLMLRFANHKLLSSIILRQVLAPKEFVGPIALDNHLFFCILLS